MRTMDRRGFLKAAGAAGLLAARLAPAAEHAQGSLSFGLVTDVHYADTPSRGTRFYRDSLEKLRQAVETFNDRKLPMAVELGDLIDAGATKSDELQYLRTIRREFEAFRGQRHYVLGNHCVAMLTKEEFLANCGSQHKESSYSFDLGGFHFVVLDADFTSDGSPYAPGNFFWVDTYIPAPQREWLAEDLKQSRDKRTIVFVHQDLHDQTALCGVKNADEVRRILEAAGNVLAVFQGHEHAGGYVKIKGIHYVTLRAMIEGPGLKHNAYAIATIDRSGRLRVEGFGRQTSKE